MDVKMHVHSEETYKYQRIILLAIMQKKVIKNNLIFYLFFTDTLNNIFSNKILLLEGTSKIHSMKAIQIALNLAETYYAFYN